MECEVYHHPHRLHEHRTVILAYFLYSAVHKMTQLKAWARILNTVQLYMAYTTVLHFRGRGSCFLTALHISTREVISCHNGSCATITFWKLEGTPSPFPSPSFPFLFSFPSSHLFLPFPLPFCLPRPTPFFRESGSAVSSPSGPGRIRADKFFGAF